MNIVLYGPPGAGKGTQASRIMERFGYVQLSTGNLIRQEIKSKSDLGRRVEGIIKAGNLVDNQTINSLVSEFLTRHQYSKGIVFDGYPRTYDQAISLDRLLAQYDMSVDLVINLQVDDSSIKKRILGRLTCESCGESFHEDFETSGERRCSKCHGGNLVKRSDDTEETVDMRLENYHKETLPVLEHYAKQGVVAKVSGTRSPDEVFSDIIRLISEKIE